MTIRFEPAPAAGGSGGAPSGSAGGDLSGTYPNPTITALPLSKLATIATARILGNNTGSTGVPLELTAAQVKTLLAVAVGDITGLGSLATVTPTGTPDGTKFLRDDDVWTAVASSPTGTAGGQLTGTYPNPSLGASVIVDANVSSSAAIGESKLALASDGAAGTPTRRSLGTTATTAAAGNDARFTDTRTPTALSVVNASVSASAAIAYSKLNLATSIVDGDVNASAAIAESKLNLASDAAAGTASRRTLGTTGNSAYAGTSGATNAANVATNTTNIATNTTNITTNTTAIARISSAAEIYAFNNFR